MWPRAADGAVPSGSQIKARFLLDTLVSGLSKYATDDQGQKLTQWPIAIRQQSFS
jgi:hypothetical protein